MSVDVGIQQPPDAELAAEYQRYRAVNTLAVVSFVAGLLSALAFLDWLLAVIPMLGIALGVLALRKIRAFPNEYTGEGFALAGALLSSVCLVGGWVRLAYIYQTEVPEGHLRISYDDLQPRADEGDLVPEEARQLDGQKVFIKGYVYQPTGGQTTGLQKFILVRDRGQCCFGGNPKITDMILVKLKGDLEAEFNMQPRKLAGTFHVQPAQGLHGLGNVLYELEADYLK
ncbi:MAG TPA: DUF3299 domain-containing protein [Pirellulales bacterium]